jgi:hypothetical protein
MSPPIEGRTVRAKLLMGLVTIAAATPLCAQADNVRSIPVPRVMIAATAPPSTADPEMNSGLAVTGVMLLLGGVSVLSSLRSRSNRR